MSDREPLIGAADRPAGSEPENVDNVDYSQLLYMYAKTGEQQAKTGENLTKRGLLGEGQPRGQSEIGEDAGSQQMAQATASEHLLKLAMQGEQQTKSSEQTLKIAYMQAKEGEQLIKDAGPIRGH